MPELPEVECLTRAVRGVVEGGTVQAARYLRKDIRGPIPIAVLERVLVGQRVTAVSRRSKYLLWRTSRGFGVFHLGMTGNMLLKASADPEEAHTHAVFTIEGAGGDRAFLHFVDPRRFGKIDCIEGDALETHASFKALGPEPLETPELGRHLFEVSRGRACPVKTFLMDQRIVVGVGNIYASEGLHRAGIHPERKAGSIARERFERLGAHIRETLEDAIRAGGTSFRDYRHSDGETGYFQVELAVYDRAGEPCAKCGKKIRQIRQAGRSTFFCPSCQK